jgi:hypothetical protein
MRPAKAGMDSPRHHGQNMAANQATANAIALPFAALIHLLGMIKATYSATVRALAPSSAAFSTRFEARLYPEQTELFSCAVFCPAPKALPLAPCHTATFTEHGRSPDRR